MKKMMIGYLAMALILSAGQQSESAGGEREMGEENNGTAPETSTKTTTTTETTQKPTTEGDGPDQATEENFSEEKLTSGNEHRPASQG